MACCLPPLIRTRAFVLAVVARLLVVHHWRARERRGGDAAATAALSGCLRLWQRVEYRVEELFLLRLGCGGRGLRRTRRGNTER